MKIVKFCYSQRIIIRSFHYLFVCYNLGTVTLFFYKLVRYTTSAIKSVVRRFSASKGIVLYIFKGDISLIYTNEPLLRLAIISTVENGSKSDTLVDLRLPDRNIADSRPSCRLKSVIIRLLSEYAMWFSIMASVVMSIFGRWFLHKPR